MTGSRELSLAEARRIALAAQKLDAPRAGKPKRASLRATVDRLGVVQMDAVNVLARAHYVPLFSRHGPYDVRHLDDETYGPRRSYFEYWGHQASLLPSTLHPLFRWRMERAANAQGIYTGLARFGKERRRYIEDVFAEVRARGPLRASQLTSSQPRSGGWWGWSDAKRALEWLFWAGRVTTSSRKSFERLYDVPERVLPANVLGAPTPTVEEAHRELVRISARALGVATEDDLADYYRLRLADVRPRILELVEEGALEQVAVRGIAKKMFFARGSAVPKEARESARAILSPFDPLVWYRARTERLFGFRYRIEIYTPEHLREHGYYVLPFLLGDALAARVDLKASRQASALVVQAAHVEPGAKPAAVASALREELRAIADWLALETIVVTKKGSLASALGRENSPRR